MPRFNDEQIRRYSRQILLREVGGHGQSRFAAARPVLFSAGEVGQLAAEYLWRAGVTELGLLTNTADDAAQLTAALVATGYPGPPAQAVRSAASAVQRLVHAAPGFTFLWLADDDLIWACCGDSRGAIGQGTVALYKTVLDHPDAAFVSGAGAMIVGSALALYTVQRILGIGPAASPDAVWQIDLTRPDLPAWG